jgi:NitT/TauT family transport system ATP-binding protein
MTLLALEDVGKRFANGVAALSGLSFQVGDGEFVSLLGPSGCGKSTALRLIAGLLAPDHGAIRWQGARPELGFVFQEPTLMPWADALANARLPLDLKQTPGAESQARARAGAAGTGRFSSRLSPPIVGRDEDAGLDRPRAGGVAAPAVDG